VAELEEANAHLRAELNAAQSKLSEVEHREQAMTSAYENLRKDFNEMHSLHAAVVQEKADLEKTEREKGRRFRNSLLKKLAELRCDTKVSVDTLGGDVWNSLLMPTSQTFWSGFG
jgi:chromosome segregation ATPase